MFKVILSTLFILATLSSKFHIHANENHSGINEKHDVCATVSCREFSESHDVKVAVTTEDNDSHGADTPFTSNQCTNHACHCLYALPDSAKAPINHLKLEELLPQQSERHSSDNIFGMFRPPRFA